MIAETATMIFWVIAVLSVLVFFHELGHFIAAKASGIRVERFSVGFPPRIIGKKIGETDYCIQWIPLGGYCKMAGMVDESLDAGGIKGEPWEFMSKTIPVRMIVLFAGPLMNILLAAMLFSFNANVLGVATVDERAKVGDIEKGTPAEDAGLLSGDLILSVDGIDVESWADMTSLIRERPHERVTLKIQRTGEIITREAAIAERTDPSGESEKLVGFLGISPVVTRHDIGVFQSIAQGFIQTENITVMLVKTVKSLVLGEESLKALGGPVIIAKMTNDFRKTGSAEFIFFIAFLSLNLGIMNLLPIPVLDGGHLMILTLEAAVRRQLPIKVKVVIQQIGMALLLLLMSFIIYNDIMRLTTAPG